VFKQTTPSSYSFAFLWSLSVLTNCTIIHIINFFIQAAALIAGAMFHHKLYWLIPWTHRTAEAPTVVWFQQRVTVCAGH